MNVLVVDDEPIVRMGLRNLVDWERYGLNCIGEASDGIEAWDIIQQEHVDIVVTDILMPRMDGLELIRLLKQSSMDVGVLVLSCLDDFVYVKEAMKLGAQDYILKPTMEPEELVENILEIRHELEQSRTSKKQWKELQKQLEKTKQEQLARKIGSYLERGEQDEQLAAELFPQGQGLFSIMVYGLSALQLHFPSYDGVQECDPIQVKWEHNRSLLYFPVELRLSEHKLHKLIYEKAQNILKSVPEEHDIFVGIGPVMSELSDLRHNSAVHEQQIDYRFYESTDRIIGEFPRIATKEVLLPHDDRNHLLRAIYHDNRDAVLHCAERLCEHIMRHKPPVSRLFPFIYELIALTVSYAREKGYTRMDEYEQQYLLADGPQSCTSVKQLCLWLNQALKTLGDYQTGLAPSGLSSNPFIRKALLFIKENYSRNISTVDIADHVKLSRSYFSDLYSREMGESLSETITRIRMDEAKRLLGEGEMKIYEIAEAVGFTDPRAFAKSFKKIVGCTPKEYTLSL